MTVFKIAELNFSSEDLKPYQVFHNKISSRELYQKDDPVIDEVVRDLKYGEIDSGRQPLFCKIVEQFSH